MPRLPRFFPIRPRTLLAVLSAAMCLAAVRTPAQTARAGSIAGTVIDRAPDHPVESVAVTLKAASGVAVQSAVTDKRGRFTLENVPPGEYRISYGYLGSENRESAPFTVAAQRGSVDLGSLDVGDQALKLEKFEVTGKQREFNNTIDRKVYSVGNDLRSSTGAASDLLQNIPSVEVDVDGNVSLRGSDNVLILINGRTSTLMGRSRSDVLAQLPAGSIDKIEVITNPSAKYKPDGTAGIINIVLKSKHPNEVAATVTASVGNDGRYNAGVSASLSQGKWGFFGSYSVRQDDRPRRSTDFRTVTDPVTGTTTTLQKTSIESARPFSQLVRGGIDFAPDEHNRFGIGADYNHRSFYRTATDHNVVLDAGGATLSAYDRLRRDPENQRTTEYSATYQHTFLEPEHELNLEFKTSDSAEQENNRYTDVYATPVQSPTYDNTLIRPLERTNETTVEYQRPLGDSGKLETGYVRSGESLDMDFEISALNPVTGLFERDPSKSNRFSHEQTIHAVYATYGSSLGRFGFLAGLRPELAYTKSVLVDTGQVITNDYNRVYPSLHTSYKLSETGELQLNYSHRVHRPDTDDLNPFPEYTDPFTLRAGNPYLKPEQIHSVEAGYQYKDDRTTFISTVYTRYVYDGITTVTRDIGNNVLLTTHENLSTSRSTGVELAVTRDFGKTATLNFSSNTYFNTIDASNLGLAGTKSNVSWTAKLGASVHVAKNTALQFNANYGSTRLTPQGFRRPTFVANFGVRQDFLQKKLAVVLTISDLLNSLKETYELNTPALREEVTRRRSSRIIFLGLVYNFGKQTKKNKDDPLKFDNQL